MSKTYPKAKLDGFDLSTAHFPPKSELPSNVNLWQQDACSPVPAEMIGRYDIVHIARIHMYLGDDLSSAIDNFKTYLSKSSVQ